MSQPNCPDLVCAFAGHAAGDRRLQAGRAWLLRGLVAGLLGALDAWLALQLVEAVGVALAARDAPLVPVLAVLGCTMAAGTALLFNWLLIEEHRGIRPSALH